MKPFDLLSTSSESIFNILPNYFMEFFENNPMMVQFAEQAKHVKGVDNSMVLKEVLDLISQEYEASVIYGIKSPEDAINDAARAVDLLFLK